MSVKGLGAHSIDDFQDICDSLQQPSAHHRSLQTITAAAYTGQHLTTQALLKSKLIRQKTSSRWGTTYQEEVGKQKVAGLAPSSSRPIPPIAMATIVVSPQPLSHLPYPVQQSSPLRSLSSARKFSFDPYCGGIEQPPLLPLGAAACLPIRSAQVAELFPAPARHMIAPDREFHEVAASGAAFPALPLSKLENLLILRAIAGTREMCRLFALTARACGALWTNVRSSRCGGSPKKG